MDNFEVSTNLGYKVTGGRVMACVITFAGASKVHKKGIIRDRWDWDKCLIYKGKEVETTKYLKCITKCIQLWISTDNKLEFRL